MAQWGDWKTAYALLLSGAKADSGTRYYFNCGGPRGMSDIDSALTAAVLTAYGASLKSTCKLKRPASWKITDGDDECEWLISPQRLLLHTVCRAPAAALVEWELHEGCICG